MAVKDLVASTGKSSSYLLHLLLADFSEADILTRPVPTANHIAWQLSHVIKSGISMLSAFTAPVAPVVPPLVTSVTRELAASNDPAAFATKDELLAAYDSVLTALGSAIETMDDAAFAKASPEKMVSFAPTLADLALLTPVHLFMHIGQIQVTRRALGKPVLF